MSAATTAGDVTIAISCYRQAEFLRAAVSSAGAQTAECRVIVVDDGSDDGSDRVAEALGVEVFRLPHRGALATFRAAIDLVETPFYVLLNADDELDVRYVELTRPRMEDPGVGFVYTGMRIVGAEEQIRSAPDFDARALLMGNFAHATSLVRKAAYEDVGGFDQGFADHHEDWALWVSMVAAGWIGVSVNEPLLTYRRHIGTSRNPSANRDVEDARWRLFRRHPRLYGLRGFARLAASSAKLALTGR